jgi:hypothetical protein
VLIAVRRLDIAEVRRSPHPAIRNYLGNVLGGDLFEVSGVVPVVDEDAGEAEPELDRHLEAGPPCFASHCADGNDLIDAGIARPLAGQAPVDDQRLADDVLAVTGHEQ